MLAIPSAIQSKFEEHLRNKAIPDNVHGLYKKWLRYYLDFCQKYHFSDIDKNSLPRFIHKLQEKSQTKAQQAQAATAIALYDEIKKTVILPQPTPQPSWAPLNDKKHDVIGEAPAVTIQ